MKHINGLTGKFNNLSFWKTPRPCGFIDIPADRSQRRYLRKPGKDFGCPHIPRMNDVFRSLQRRDGFGTEQAVGVRNNADNNGSSLSLSYRYFTSRFRDLGFSITQLPLGFISAFISACEGAPCNPENVP